MTLHIFNPEHDIALASNLANFTAPHAGRQLRHDLGFLPVLWAGKDDLVVVDDVETAKRALGRLWPRLKSGMPLAGVQQQLVPIAALKRVVGNMGVSLIDPWGWDAALCAQLARKGGDVLPLPSKEQIVSIRQLSHRRSALTVLRSIREQVAEGTVGECLECTTPDEVMHALSRWHMVVLKMPWSSSGRGLRFLSDANASLHQGWLQNVLRLQGSVMVEPYYNKVKDFGMEFLAGSNGRIAYQGLSLFHTAKGAYQGNLLATERAKQEFLLRYVDRELLARVRQSLCTTLQTWLEGRYAGPLGVDMMIVAGPQGLGFMLHPCVEINLRRTMGHVALSLNALVNKDNDDEIRKVMRIAYEENVYKLKIEG